MQSSDPSHSERRAARQAWWFAAALLLVAAAALALRFGTHVLDASFVFDEWYICQPIIALIEHGWSLQTAIDFEETKGPGMIWLYALAGEVVGSSLNDLRLISAAMFVLGAIPLLDMARRCGVQGAGLIVAAIWYVLLPYHAPLGQLVMSEPSFVALSLAACWVVVWGISPSRRGEETNTASESRGAAARLLPPILLAILLSILLHNRIHAVALGGAVCFVAIERLGWRGSLPWIVAVALAGVSRFPLWWRWGGLVSPAYQDVHAVGLGLDGLTYLLASFAPLLAIFMWPALTREEGRRRAWMLAAGAAVGLSMSLLAPADLQKTFTFEGQSFRHFGGIIATALRTATDEPILQRILMSALAMLGGAGLGALGAVAWTSPADGSSPRGLVNRLQFWTLLLGWAMYALSATPVYDRYVLAWTMLLPLAWKMELPRCAAIVQIIGLAAIAGWLVARWLM